MGPPKVVKQFVSDVTLFHGRSNKSFVCDVSHP